MLRDADELLRTRPEFNFDKWLTQARSWGNNNEEKDLFEKMRPRLSPCGELMVIRLSSTTPGGNGRD